jgi:hypothetical protein
MPSGFKSSASNIVDVWRFVGCAALAKLASYSAAVASAGRTASGMDSCVKGEK